MNWENKMKQKLDTRGYFDNLDEDSKFELLHEAQLKVQRLERISGDLLAWREGSEYYEKAEADLRLYFEGE